MMRLHTVPVVRFELDGRRQRHQTPEDGQQTLREKNEKRKTILAKTHSIVSSIVIMERIGNSRGGRDT